MSNDQHTTKLHVNVAGKVPPLVADAQQDAAPTAARQDDEDAAGIREDQVRTYLKKIESLFEEREFEEACGELRGFSQRLCHSMTAFLDLNGNSIDAFQEIEKQMQVYVAMHQQIYRYRDHEFRRAAKQHDVLRSISKRPR